MPKEAVKRTQEGEIPIRDLLRGDARGDATTKALEESGRSGTHAKEEEQKGKKPHFAKVMKRILEQGEKEEAAKRTPTVPAKELQKLDKPNFTRTMKQILLEEGKKPAHEKFPEIMRRRLEEEGEVPASKRRQEREREAERIGQERERRRREPENEAERTERERAMRRGKRETEV